MKLLVTEELSKRYGSRRGIEDLSMSLEEGSICGFLGPNGVGKSTAIRLILGFLRPSRGRATVFGLDCWRQGARLRAEVGYVPGDLRLYPWLTTRGALALFGRIRRRALLERGLELAGRFGLEPDLRVSRMSRGTRQKLGLVLALAPDPRLLILDEPSTALDPVVQETLRAELRGLADRGRTVLLSSHTLSEVEDLCQRVLILRDGRLIVDTTLEDLRARAPRQVVLRFREGVPTPDEPAPPGVTLEERAGRLWRGTMTGPVGDLLGWLSRQSLEDAVIAPPDMETLFRRYYEA